MFWQILLLFVSVILLFSGVEGKGALGTVMAGLISVISLLTALISVLMLTETSLSSIF